MILLGQRYSETALGSRRLNISGFAGKEIVEKLERLEVVKLRLSQFACLMWSR